MFKVNKKYTRTRSMMTQIPTKYTHEKFQNCSSKTNSLKVFYFEQLFRYDILIRTIAISQKFTCSKSRIETLETGVKYVQS